MFLTMYLAVYDLESGIIKYSNAGHHGFIKIDKNNKPDISGSTHNTFVGFFDNIQYSYSEFQLEANETFLLYTDGITDAVDNEENMYGLKRFVSNISLNNSKNLTVLGDLIIEDVLSFEQGNRFDDITVIMLRRNC